MWKYGVSPYHNNTDKNWINVKDSTWTQVIEPLGKILSKDKSAVANCRAGARSHPAAQPCRCLVGAHVKILCCCVCLPMTLHRCATFDAR